MHARQLVALTLIAAAAWAAFAGPVSERSGILTDPSGRTVYVFDHDSPGKSNCRSGCLNMWPPFQAEAGARPDGDFSLIDAEGGKQWAYRDRPLYFYAGDEKAGDRNGDRIGGVWHVIPAVRQAPDEKRESGFSAGYGY